MPSQFSLKNKALHYLSLREHSRLELGRKLARYAQENDNVEQLLDWLEQQGFLSCNRFIEAVIRRRANSYGNSRILAELQSHDVDPDALSETKKELIKTEARRAYTVWQKKFGHEEHHSLTPEQRAKQMRFLAQRGFSLDVIRDVVKGKKL